MATTAHRIVSHYTTPSQEGDQVPEEDIDALWRSEPTKIKPLSRHYKIPTFVRGSLDPLQNPVPADVKGKARGQDVVEWYRTLGASRIPTPAPSMQAQVADSSSSNSPRDPHQRGSSLPLPPGPSLRHRTRRNKPDWFIRRALLAQGEAGTPSVSAPASPSHGLADLLAQQPPPRPDEAPFKPPIWYGLGPDNKGFAMLKKGGWSEGHGLGSAHPVTDRSAVDEPRELAPSGEADDVIDLTVSDPPSPQQSEDEDSLFLHSDVPDPPAPSFESPSNALLTPLRPILKSDRLGIGLKAKKKSSFTRAEIREHIRASEASRKKAELERRGKGHKAIARQARKEEEKRRALLTYMNS